MSFGRQKNMVRRAYRPDESFHRERRRMGVDRASILGGGRRRRSIVAQILQLFGLKRRR